MTTKVIYSSTTTRSKPRQRRFERRTDAPRVSVDTNPHYFQVAWWLLRLRFMTTMQIARILDPPRKRSAVYRLLRRMYDARIISRFDVPAERSWGKPSAYGAVRAIHCPDTKAAHLVTNRLGVSRSEIAWRPRDNLKRSTLRHTLATNDVLITMHRGAQRIGYDLEIVQTERDIHRRGGHDFVVDPEDGIEKPVKADAVCRLVRPDGKSIWLSLEIDMGTEGEGKIRRKYRLHRRHVTSGAFEARHAARNSRVAFIVGDVRNPLLARPLTQGAWQRRVRVREQQLKEWAGEEGMNRQFWFTARFSLTDDSVWQQPVWLWMGAQYPVFFV